MKSPKEYVLALLMLVFGATMGIAQAQTGRVSVDVPFDFVVGKANLAAGTYRVVRQPESPFLTLTNAQGHSVCALLFPGGKVDPKNGRPYLVFRRYGNEAFLNQVVFSANNNYELPRSSKEKEMMAKQTSGEQVAVLIQMAQ